MICPAGDRIRSSRLFLSAMNAPAGLTPEVLADWQIIANAARALLSQVEQRCPPGQLAVEATQFVLRTMSVVNGAFVVQQKSGGCE